MVTAIIPYSATAASLAMDFFLENIGWRQTQLLKDVFYTAKRCGLLSIGEPVER
ncbi:MAG: hypothetical protein J0I10_22315 [Verrucomicrobia bacterium]|nr:hypothetical protein [Verrucomicrobiota bacterium]